VCVCGGGGDRCGYIAKGALAQHLEHLKVIDADLLLPNWKGRGRNRHEPATGSEPAVSGTAYCRVSSFAARRHEALCSAPALASSPAWCRKVGVTLGASGEATRRGAYFLVGVYPLVALFLAFQVEGALHKPGHLHKSTQAKAAGGGG
jgi:hypothetical protein